MGWEKESPLGSMKKARGVEGYNERWEGKKEKQRCRGRRRGEASGGEKLGLERIYILFSNSYYYFL